MKMNKMGEHHRKFHCSLQWAEKPQRRTNPTRYQFMKGRNFKERPRPKR